VEAFLVLSTFPDPETARRVGRQLVEQKCAACVNILPPVESIYRWQGTIEEARETLAFFKTSETRLELLQTSLRELHPYEVPEIIAFRIAHGLPQYLEWVAENCR
jgi:periplasmic divalent cation tolerance protein